MHAEGSSGSYKAELERLTRFHSLLSQIHQTILRQRDRQELFEQICKVAVELGGFRLAFIGWIDPRSLQVVPIAKAGNHAGYLDHAQIHADERPTGMGPAGRAIRSGKPYICNDYFNDPVTQPWRTFAAEHGLRSVAVFPLRQAGVVCAVFCLYSGEPGYFQEREVQMLEEMALDLSYALDNLLCEQKRQQAEEAARRFAAIMETTTDAMMSEGLDGTIQTWNAAAERIYGYTAEEVIGKNIFVLVPFERWPETEKLLIEVRQGRLLTGIETERLHKGGFRFPVSITLAPLYDSQGKITGISKISRDISEQNASLAALQEGSALLEIMINEAPTGLAMLDRDLRVLAASKRWKEDCGLADVDVVGHTHDELFPAAPAHWPEQHKRVLGGETVVAPEDSFTRADGQLRWLSRTLRPWMAASGEIGGLVILSEDITERKLADDARRRSEEFLKIFIEDTPVALAMFDRELRYLGANQCWRRDTARKDALLIGRYRYEVNPEIPESWKDADRRALAGETVRCEEDLFTRADGSLLWLRWEVRPWQEADGSVGGILIFAEDITERKRAQAALQQAEAQLRAVVDHLEEALFVTTPEGKLLTWNPAARRLYGIPEQGFGMTDLSNYPEIVTVYGDDGAPLPLERWPMSRILSGEQIQNLEHRTRPRHSDHDLVLSYAGRMVEIGDGRKLAFLRCQDVTEQRQVEQQLRASQTRFEAVLDSLDEGILLVASDGLVLHWNPVVARVLNLPVEQPKEFRVADFRSYMEMLNEAGEAIEAARTPLQRILAGETLNGQVFKIRRKEDGRVFSFNYFGALLRVENGNQMAFVRLREVTE